MRAGGGGWRVWSCWGSKRALSSGGEESMWAVGGYGGGGVAVSVEAVNLDSLCFGAEEGMWAVGAVGCAGGEEGMWVVVWWEHCCGW